MSVQSVGTRKSLRLRRLQRGGNNNKLHCNLSLFDKLPNELVLRIFQEMQDEHLVQLRKTCTRFRDIILSSTKRVDHHTLAVDPDLYPREAMELILECPRLRVLSLIDSSSASTLTILKGALNHRDQRDEFARHLAQRCPYIERIDVASIHALRLVRTYVKHLDGPSNLVSLRVFCSNVRTVAILLLDIVKYTPRLTCFKLLRREATKEKATTCAHLYEQLWTLLGKQLTQFSINVEDRHILANCITQMVKVQRLVIWNLNEAEVLTLVTHVKNLKIVVLMNCSIDAFKHLVHLQHMTDLTFHVKRPEASGYLPHYIAEELYDVFRMIGRQLTRLSLVLKDVWFGSYLSPIALFCNNLTDLKLRDINQYDYGSMYNIIKNLPCLKYVWWGDNITLNSPDTGGRGIAQDLLFESKCLLAIYINIYIVNAETGISSCEPYKYYLKAMKLSSSTQQDAATAALNRDLPRRDRFTVKCIPVER